MRRIMLLIIGILAAAITRTASQSDYKLAEQDSLALVAFYWATDGPNWISNQDGFGFDNLTSEWQETYDGKFNKWFDGPAKDWFGVKVQKRSIEGMADSTYRVTWLWPVIGRRTDGQNNLRGYIPREIGLMTALEQFRVNGNDGFTFELIPDEIYHESLEHFDTEAAWFGGGLSDALRNCIGIRKMNIRYNNYDFMPNLDFLDEDAVRNLDGTQWFYNSRFSYFYMERIVDFFYSISPNPMEFGLEARDMFDVGDEIEIVAPLGTSVEMICNDAGMREDDITYQWFKDGLSKFGKKNKNYEIASVKESDYGHYTTRITNEYVKSYDQNGNYGEVFTKGIHLVAEARAPIIYKSTVDNSGQYIDLYFDKDMTGASGFADMKVTVEGVENNIVNAEVRGRINREVRLYLEEPVREGELVIMNYNGQSIKDANGGVLDPLEEMEVENRTRVAPQILGATTTLDGNGIVVNFDYFIDPESLDEDNFIVEGESPYEVTAATVMPGKVNAFISKSLLLTLANAITDTAEVITVQYLEGKVRGLYSGSLEPSEIIPVENVVTQDRTSVLLQFEDGSEELQDILIKGSWKVAPIQMYDDGSNGDITAGDHVWSSSIALAKDEYSWDVLSRTISAVVDTIVTTDSLGNTVLTLVEGTENNDSILSSNFNLEFSILERETVGDTVYGIFNRDVTFNVQVDASSEDIYLMGINNDWNDGILMESIGENIYSYTVPKYTAGDEIFYNYRRGLNWENVTPESRAYEVKNAENIINDIFGVFTDVEDEILGDFSVFPNPSQDGIFILEGFENFEVINIFNSLGEVIYSMNNNHRNILKLDLTARAKGLYFLSATSEKNNQVITFKLLIE